MYNEKRKKQYIQIALEADKMSEQILPRWFSLCEPYETKLNRDLCEWNSKEIIDFYQSLVLKSLETLRMIHSAYTRYTSWCLANSMIPDSQNHFTEIDREVLNTKCINKAYLRNGIVTREELLKMLKDDKMVKNPFEKFIILGIFEGMGGKQLTDFQNISIDIFKSDKMQLKKRVLSYSKELKKLAEESSEEYTLYMYTNSREINASFDVTDTRIIKSRVNSKELSGSGWNHKINIILKKICDYNNTPAFTAAMLSESGRLEMIRNYMKKDNISAIEAIKKYDDEITERYGRIQGRERYCDRWSEFLT